MEYNEVTQMPRVPVQSVQKARSPKLALSCTTVPFKRIPLGQGPVYKGRNVVMQDALWAWGCLEHRAGAGTPSPTCKQRHRRMGVDSTMVAQVEGAVVGRSGPSEGQKNKNM